MRSCLYKAQTVHERCQGTPHRFSYSFFSILLDLDELDGLERRLRLFTVNRPSLLWSYHDADHGLRDGTPAKTWFTEHVKRHLGLDVKRVELLCMPRLLGFVFNPISVFFGYNQHDELCAVLYEVSNAYKQKHCYLSRVKPGETHHQHGFDKEFYVSPYTPITGHYFMKVNTPGDVFNLYIAQTDADNNPVLTATYSGKRAPLADKQLAFYLISYFPMSFKVWWRILWQAVRLRLKGHRFKKPPAAPKRQITINEMPAI